jgi:hypothetical protein
MDTASVLENNRISRVFWLIIVFALLAVPASAAGGNPTTVYELPMPVPAMPAVIDPLTIEEIPSISRSQLPQVSGLPSRLSAINAADSLSEAVMNRATSTMNNTMTSIDNQLAQYRGLLTDVRMRVGSPTSDVMLTAQDVDGNFVDYTAYSAAAQMSNSIYTTVAYLRGLSNLGGVGLNLAFIVVGLAWVAIVRLIDLAIRVPIAMIRVVRALISDLIKIVNLIINIAQALAEWINITTGPAT